MMENEDDITVEDLRSESVAESGSEMFDFVKEYFPDKSDIRQKGRLDKSLPYFLSTIEEYPNLFPPLKSREDLLDRWLDNIEKRLISVEGKSRDEFKEILKSIVRLQDAPEDEKGEGFKKYLKADSE